MVRLSTFATPGARHAASSASSRSAHEAAPQNDPHPTFSTVTRLASISAARRTASSILRLISMGVTRGTTY
jgi:hypothetical protein